jgi:hypothetical protein
MNATIKSKNLFLKRIASHLGHKSINNKDFISDCKNMLNHGGATNYFIYCYDNKEFLKTNKDLIKSSILQLFEDLGESPRTYNYTLFGKPLDEEVIVEILAFLFSSKIPTEQGGACDWLVWCGVENELFTREEEIQKGKWSK